MLVFLVLLLTPQMKCIRGSSWLQFSISSTYRAATSIQSAHLNHLTRVAHRLPRYRTATYSSVAVASTVGVLQTGYAPNTDYKCYLGALSGTTYICPSTVGGEVRVDTAVLTPSSASLATPAVASIAVSNSDAVQQGTADGNTYQYAAQCVPGSALTCVTDGVWTTPALDALTSDVTVAADSAGNAIASNTAYTYVRFPPSSPDEIWRRHSDPCVRRSLATGASLEPYRAGSTCAMLALLSPRRH